MLMLACKFAKGFGPLVTNALELQAFDMDLLACKLKG
jgi:hypothetical protein